MLHLADFSECANREVPLMTNHFCFTYFHTAKRVRR